VHRRHPGVAVDSGVSSRTTVRTQTGTQFRSSGSSQTVGGGANVRERSSGQGNQGNIGARSSPQGQPGAAQGGQGGQTTGRSGTSGSSGGQMPANR
jgi:hypothetical protein